MMSFSKKRPWAILTMLVALAVSLTAFCATAYAEDDESLSVKDYSLFTQNTTIANIPDTIATWELDVAFSVTATSGEIDVAPANVPDAASKIADITLNGKRMGDIFNYVYSTYPQQFQFAYIRWYQTEEGARLLKLYLPVALYDFTAYPNSDVTQMGDASNIMGFKGDGTDVVVLPQGLALPGEEGALASEVTLNVTADKVSGNAASIIVDHVKMDQVGATDDGTNIDWLYFVPVMNVTAANLHDGNVEMVSRYADYVYVNGVKASEKIAENLGYRIGFKIDYSPWYGFFSEDLSPYGWHVNYLLGFNCSLFKKDGTDVIVLKKGFTPLTGVTLDKDYAYAVTFDLTKLFGQRGTFTEVVNRIDSFEQVAAGTAEINGNHNLPTTVNAVLATGEKVALPVAWDWTPAATTGNVTVNGTVDTTGYTLVQNLTAQVSATVTVVSKATLTVANSALTMGSVEFVGKNVNVYKITVVFDESATVEENGDAFSIAGGVKVNGRTLTEIKTSAPTAWQYAVTATWAVSNGNRALEITVPVNCDAVKNDGTDAVTLPKGFAVPEYNSLAEDAALPAMEAVAKTATVIDVGVLNEMSNPDNPGQLRSFYSMYVAFSLPSCGNINGLELKSSVSAYIYLNGQPMSAYLAAGPATMFVQSNINQQNYSLLKGENGADNSFVKYNDNCYIMLIVMHGGYMKNPEGKYMADNIVELKQGLELGLGFALDANYAYAIHLTEEGTDTFNAIADMSKTVKSVGLPTSVAVGKELPTTVQVELVDGTFATLNATADWQKKDEVGTYEVTYTVENPNGFVLINGGTFTFTYEITVYDYISDFATIMDVDCEYGATFSSLGLPTKVNAITAKGETVVCDVEWQSTGFDGSVEGEQTVIGAVYAPAGVAVGEGVSLEISVKVTVAAAPVPQKVITSISEVETPAAIKVGEKHNLPSKVTAQLDDGTTVELSVTWSWTTATQVGNISVTGTVDIGEYVLAEGVSATIVKEVTVSEAAASSNSGGSACGGNVAYAGSILLAMLIMASAMKLMRKKYNA